MLTNEKLLEQAKADKKRSDEAHTPWRKTAREDFLFVPGGSGEDSGQWDKDELDVLRIQQRPALTINQIEPMIEGVTGTEVNNRLQSTFKAREPDDKGVVNAANEVAIWARDNDLEEEDTDAIRNALICGMGWIATRMEYDEDPDGKFAQVSEDPLAFRWDPDARRPNLTDARWVGLVKDFDEDEFESLWPGKEGSSAVFGSDSADQDDEITKDRDDEAYRGGDQNDAGLESRRKFKRVFEYQYWRREPMVRLIDPHTDKITMLTDSDFEKVRKDEKNAQFTFSDMRNPTSGEEIVKFIRQRLKIYYRAFFSGDEVLEHGPNPYKNGPTLQCITARRHHVKNTWYGIVRAMKDPQRLTNKILSQWVHHYNSNPKGGFFYENDAFDNPDEFKNEIATANPAIKTESGALSGGKIQPIQATQTPSSLPQMLQFAENAAPRVTAISQEFLGIAGRDQPIGLEQTRKLATMSVVAPIFSNYRKYRKNNGRLLLFYMKEYFDVQTMLRVVSKENREFVPAIKDADIARYDVHVDDAPLSPSMKATVFSVLKDFMQFLPPEIATKTLPRFLEFSPLPQKLVEGIVEALDAASQPDPMAIEAQKAQLTKLVAETYSEFMDGALKQAKAETESGKSSLEREKLDVAQLDSFMNLLQTKIQNKANGAATT